MYSCLQVQFSFNIHFSMFVSSDRKRKHRKTGIIKAPITQGHQLTFLCIYMITISIFKTKAIKQRQISKCTALKNNELDLHSHLQLSNSIAVIYNSNSMAGKHMPDSLNVRCISQFSMTQQTIILLSRIFHWPEKSHTLMLLSISHTLCNVTVTLGCPAKYGHIKRNAPWKTHMPD